jgi:YegS/Rv2252/BmrU family lipid kinase
MKPLVVYNPAAGGGATARMWPAIAEGLNGAIGPFEAAASAGIGHAASLVRSALGDGPRLVVAVGGDGTASEAIDGILADGARSAGKPMFGFVATGTGRDFRRSFGWDGGYEADIARIRSGRSRAIDLGRLTHRGEAGRTAVRHFNNVASFGLSGRLVKSVNASSLRSFLRPKQLFKVKSVTTLLGYRFQRVRLEIDDTVNEIMDIAVVAVANGRFFGGGMMIAPDADPADGLLDVIVIRGYGKAQLIRSLNCLYDGSHLTHPAVVAYRGRRIRATPLDEDGTGPVLIDADGEQPGSLPASFEILPGALTLRG